jgi:hypothetical protein
MNKKQTEHIRRHLSIFRGILNEIGPRKMELRKQLQEKPENFELINRQTGALEGEMDALLLAIEFIEGWPEQECLKTNRPCNAIS